MNTKSECSKQEEQPQNKFLGSITHGKEVIISSKFSKGNQIDVLKRTNQSVVSWVVTVFQFIKLDLVLSNQEESIGKSTNSNNHCNNKVLNVWKDSENNVDERGHLINQSHEVQTFGPNKNSNNSLNDSLWMLGGKILAWIRLVIKRFQNDIDWNVQVQDSTTDINIRPFIFEITSSNLVSMKQYLSNNPKRNQKIQNSGYNWKPTRWTWFTLQCKIACLSTIISFHSFDNFMEFFFVQVDSSKVNKKLEKVDWQSDLQDDFFVLDIQKLNEDLNCLNCVQVKIFWPQNTMQELLAWFILQDPLHTKSNDPYRVTLVRWISYIFTHLFFVISFIDIGTFSTINPNNPVLISIINTQSLLVNHLGCWER